MNVLELFAGIGGMSLGLERAGLRVVGQVEINEFGRSILSKHWPEVPKHDDVRTALNWWLSEPRPPVHVIAGGYPCQPESVAGRRLGTDDDRWLWPEFARIVHALRPRWVIGENVDGHRSSGLRFVLRDLERLEYTATAGTIRACEVGAPHPRPRVFVVAHAYGVDGAAGVGPGQGRQVCVLDGGSGTWADPSDWILATPPQRSWSGSWDSRRVGRCPNQGPRQRRRPRCRRAHRTNRHQHRPEARP